MGAGRRSTTRRLPGRTPLLAVLAALTLLVSSPAALAVPTGAWDGPDVSSVLAVPAACQGTEDRRDRDSDGAEKDCDSAAPAPPQANPDAFAGVQDEHLFVDAPGVLANDAPGTATLQEASELTEKGGRVTVSESGAFTYRPPRGFHGVDVFAYRLSGPGGDVLAVAQIGLVLRTCQNAEPTLRGTPGRDVLRGTPDPDVILGRGGNDVIIGAGGDDLLCGGSGVDRISGGPGNDLIFAGGGDDDASGGKGKDRIYGGEGGDRLSGGPGRDRVFGGAGRDELED